MAATEAPPVMEARRWLQGVTFPADRPLINVSQAAPVEPPPLALRQAMAEAALRDDAAHLYGPVLGLPALRAEIAAQWSQAYGGAVAPAQVAITQGCNLAFTAVLATLAGTGDEVILPTPWYFNHKMWFDMQGITTVALRTGPDLIPDAGAAAALITPRTAPSFWSAPTIRAGWNIPRHAGRLPRSGAPHGLALIVDETYRDFDSRHSAQTGGRPHDLFTDRTGPRR